MVSFLPWKSNITTECYLTQGLKNQFHIIIINSEYIFLGSGFSTEKDSKQINKIYIAIHFNFKHYYCIWYKCIKNVKWYFFVIETCFIFYFYCIMHTETFEFLFSS